MKKSFPLLIAELEELTEAIEQAGPSKLISDLVRSRLDTPDMQALFVDAKPIPERNLVEVMVCDYPHQACQSFSICEPFLRSLASPPQTGQGRPTLLRSSS
jgi:hypothetical protein